MTVHARARPSDGWPTAASVVAIDPLQLLPGERVLMRVPNGSIRVTTLRVQSIIVASSRSRYVSIPVDSVASCGLTTTAHPTFIALAFLCGSTALFGALFPTTTLPACVGLPLVFAAVFTALYFGSRSTALLVASIGGERIRLSGTIARTHAYRDVLEAVDQARAARTSSTEIPTCLPRRSLPIPTVERPSTPSRDPGTRTS